MTRIYRRNPDNTLLCLPTIKNRVSIDRLYKDNWTGSILKLRKRAIIKTIKGVETN